MRFSARWHFAGTPVVYLAESPAAALLEVCVHTAANDIPPSFTLLKIGGLTRSLEIVDWSRLAEDWTAHPEATQEIGSEWLRSGRTAHLRVPSALVPETYNYLLNPLHLQASQFQVLQEYHYPFDQRLKG